MLGTEHPPHQPPGERDRDGRGVLGDLARERPSGVEQLSGRVQAAQQTPILSLGGIEDPAGGDPSIARLMPTTRGKNQLEAASGMIPRRANTKPMRASSAASRTSIGSVIVAPIPTAGPLMAAITGFRQRNTRSVSSPPLSRAEPGEAVAPRSRRSRRRPRGRRRRRSRVRRR